MALDLLQLFDLAFRCSTETFYREINPHVNKSRKKKSHVHLSPCICLKYRITTLINLLQCETTQASVGQLDRPLKCR